MKITFLITLLPLFSSCSKIVKTDIDIYPTIQKDDSILILNVKNNTESNLMIEFPVLDNFFYRDEFDSSNPEILMTKKSFNLLKDSADILKINTINCLTIKKIIQTNDTLDLKFLKAKSKKKYYLKIKRYRSGKTIIFEDDGFDIFLDKISKENIFKLKKQNCGGYKYFSGSFKFYPEKIILP